MSTQTSRHSTDLRSAASSVSDLLTRGAIAGLFGGIVFAVANMYYAIGHGKPEVAPFLSISTIFRASDMPTMSPQSVITGLVVHVGLSMLFGMVFAVLVAAWLRTPLMLLAGGIAYGLLLYLVNFQVLGRLFFPWFVNPKGPNQLFELWIHPVTFGLVLVPFFLGMAPALRRTSTEA